MKILLIAGTVVVLLIAGAFLLGKDEVGNEGPVACTMDAMICPDGSAVGRSGPLCEFEACPEMVERESTIAALNERILTDGIHITPLRVTEDSRCPADVVCVQAGTVALDTLLEVDGVTTSMNMSLGTPISFLGKRIELINVLPSASSVAAIVPTDYRFEFRVY